jgi:predicted  nucleic acid-binding Zn-ribbon protein
MVVIDRKPTTYSAGCAGGAFWCGYGEGDKAAAAMEYACVEKHTLVGVERFNRSRLNQSKPKKKKKKVLPEEETSDSIEMKDLREEMKELRGEMKDLRKEMKVKEDVITDLRAEIQDEKSKRKAIKKQLRGEVAALQLAEAAAV